MLIIKGWSQLAVLLLLRYIYHVSVELKQWAATQKDCLCGRSLTPSSINSPLTTKLAKWNGIDMWRLIINKWTKIYVGNYVSTRCASVMATIGNRHYATSTQSVNQSTAFASAHAHRSCGSVRQSIKPATWT